MKTQVKIIEHTTLSGKKFTQEIHNNHAAAWEVIKDQFGQVIQTMGSGGSRPWDKK